MTLILTSDQTAERSLGNLYGTTGPSDYAALLDFTRDFYRVRENGETKSIPLEDALIGKRTTVATSFNDAGVLVDEPIGSVRVNTTQGNQGRLDAGIRGLLSEPTSTNYLLNSTTPATQTVTVATGTYTLSVYGTGSATASGDLSAGAGVAATDGSPVTMTVTGSGVVTITVAGTLTGFQLEKLAFPTSLIKTTGATVSRNRDYAELSQRLFDAIGGDSGQGTAIAHVTPYKGVTGSSFVFRYSRPVGEAANGSIQLQMVAPTSATYIINDDSSVAQFGAALPLPVGEAPFKTGMAFQADDFAGFLKGRTIDTDGAGTVPTSVSRIEIGGTNLSGAGLGGIVTKLIFYNRRLTNDELIAAVG
ncbi:hypothetical protein [Sulfitobacter pontiacus]|uniref:hypothetical protein n=1 Tax=Sulfitobacter pontiacus TaxID=60137 RepID=UPI0015DEA6F0|nr:hypothetical protein [Sulfitobacter pontiacus]QLL42433.1 hypothetical protein G6548_07805 [Sulfitobacter pontiacus]